MTWLLLIPGGALLVWASGAWWLDRHGQRPARAGEYDAIVVAGCRVMPDGTPSSALTRRVRLAVRCYDQGLAPRIVLTGGVGRTAPGGLDPLPSEARVAAELCTGWGVPFDALLLEEHSTTTEENARFAAALIDGRVLVVSDSFHVYRCRRMFSRHFHAAEAVGAVPGHLPSRARLALREVLAIVRHGGAGRL